MKKLEVLSFFILLVIMPATWLFAQEIEADDNYVYIRGENTNGYMKFYPTGTVFYVKRSTAPDGNAFHINVANNHTKAFSISKEWSTPHAFTVYSDGTAYLKNIAVTSDSTLKDVITEIGSQVDNVKKLRGVTFKWKTDNGQKGDKKTYGLLAQDLEKVYPDMVFRGDSGELGIFYTELIPVLLQVTQEQQALIETQAKQLLDIEKRLSKLEKRSK
ncbi:MAG: tail fiber domain-containing protein [Prolixibacteraceae bacterium]|nr:tail fiber domain-containing protein [Prolixibacteraceae bacterium]